MYKVYEENDLVKRSIIVRKDVKEHSFNGSSIGFFIGILTDKPHIYKDCAIITHLDGKVYGRYYELVDTEDNFKMPLSPTQDMVLSDEETPHVADVYDYEQVVRNKKDGYLDSEFHPELYQNSIDENLTGVEFKEALAWKDKAGEVTVKDFEDATILRVGVATNGHKWSTACGHGTYTFLRFENIADFRSHIHVGKEGDLLAIVADGDSELEQIKEAAKFIWETLEYKTRKAE